MKIKLNQKFNRSGFTIFAAIVGSLTIAIFVTGIVFYVLVPAHDAFQRFEEKRSNDIQRASQTTMLLHDRFEVGQPVEGKIELDIPESALAKIGQWRFWRSTDLSNWSPVASLWTDELSAQMFVHDLFQMETNISGMNLPSVYFSATLDSGDQ